MTESSIIIKFLKDSGILKIFLWFNQRLITAIHPMHFGTFRQLKPVSQVFGYDRGTQSIARYYIDCFISQHATDIHGHVLEIGDNVYTSQYGRNVTRLDVLHVVSGNSKATIVADLVCASEIPSESFDCIIMTQTLQFIYDKRAALSHCFRILKPGGILLVTLSGISQISRYDMDRWGEYWRFTSLSANRLFTEFFHEEQVSVEAHGNVLAAISFLEGLASSELKKEELDYKDRDYEVIITVRAIK